MAKLTENMQAVPLTDRLKKLLFPAAQKKEPEATEVEEIEEVNPDVD